MLRESIKQTRAALSLCVVFTLLLGGVYPAVITGLAQAGFHFNANGSLVERGGVIRGSWMLGQEFSSPQYFWGRLSATDKPYNAANSSGSNLNPGNPKILEAVNTRIKALQQADSGNHEPIPVDLVTASASGLDPHISVAAANYQAARVARARKMPLEAVQKLIDKHTEKPLFGLGGIAYINVLRLNLALDEAGLSQGSKK